MVLGVFGCNMEQDDLGSIPVIIQKFFSPRVLSGRETTYSQLINDCWASARLDRYKINFISADCGSELSTVSESN